MTSARSVDQLATCGDSAAGTDPNLRRQRRTIHTQASSLRSEAHVDGTRAPVAFTLPAELAALVADGAGVGALVEGRITRPDWLRPAVITDAQRRAAAVAVRDLEVCLAPAPRAWIGGRVVSMLAHYWQPDLDERVAEAVALDWGGALAEFPRSAIGEACAWWIRAENRRPTPAAIRARCQDAVRRERRLLARLRAIAQARPALEDGRAR